jgi:catechol-2,3-dioxygenase
VGSLAELQAAQQRLQAAGVEVIGPTDHHIIRSIYFFDPNGLRLELTVPTVDDVEMQRLATQAHADLAAWTER